MKYIFIIALFVCACKKESGNTEVEASTALVEGRVEDVAKKPKGDSGSDDDINAALSLNNLLLIYSGHVKFKVEDIKSAARDRRADKIKRRLRRKLQSHPFKHREDF